MAEMHLDALDWTRLAHERRNGRQIAQKLCGRECRGREMEQFRDREIEPRLARAHEQLKTLRHQRCKRNHIRPQSAWWSGRILDLAQQRSEQQRQDAAKAARERPARLLRSIAQRARATTILLDRSDRSQTIYLMSGGGIRVRLSNHELGWADYGTREQVHHGGPDIVIDDEDGPLELIDRIIDECRGWSGSVIDSYDRHCLAQFYGALRLMRERARRSERAAG